MEKRKFKPGTYSYRPLKNLKEGTVVDVYGIVKFFKLPFKTRGTDFMMIVTIVDESLIQVGEKLKCLLFSHEEENLPQVKIGSVIRFHRLRVNVHNRELQGRNGAGFSWLVVDNQRDGCLVPKTSSTNYTFTDFDRQKIKSLFCVKLQNQELRSQDLVKNLQQLREGIYFDFLCQVVAVSAVDLNVCYLLQVWDGNHPSCPLYAVEVNERNMILHTDMELRKVAKDWLVDVCVFDDHCEKASTIKPGMFVKLLNLHCPRHKIPDIFNATYSEELELVLHGGTSYGRGIKILSETDPEIEDLKMKLEQLRRAAKEVETTRTSVKRSAESSPSKSVKRKPVETGLCSSPNKIVSRTDSEMTNESDDTSSEILTDSEADIEDYVKDAPEIVLSTATGLCSSPNKIVSRTDSEMTNESDDTSSEILTDSEADIEDYVKDAPEIVLSTATGLCSSPNKIVSRTDSEMTNESDDTSSEILTDSEADIEDYVKDAPEIVPSTATGLCSSPNKIVSRTDSEMTNESDDTSSEILTDSEADIEDYVKDAPEIVPSTATGLCSSPNKIVSRTDSEMTNESDDTSSEILTDSQSNFEDYVKVAPKILFSVVSVIQGHQSVEFAHICDIINTPAPMKFRLLTRVWDYCPKLTSVSDFLSLFCPECNYTTPINNYKLEPSTFHIKDGVEYYRCPYCASKNISDDVPLMEYIFLLRFVLTDGHYFLIANLWRDEAVKFFRQITPLEFISDANVVNKVRSCLARIHSRRMKNKNKTLIECCIKSFHGHRSAVCYEMFDTFLS